MFTEPCYRDFGDLSGCILCSHIWDGSQVAKLTDVCLKLMSRGGSLSILEMAIIPTLQLVWPD
jgi:hypothetical protein